MSDDRKPSITSWAYVTEGTSLTIILLLGFYLGHRLDTWQGTSPWFTLIGAAFGFGFGLYNFIRRFVEKS